MGCLSVEGKQRAGVISMRWGAARRASWGAHFEQWQKWKILLRPAKQGVSQSEWLTRGGCTGRVQDGCCGPEYRAQSVVRNAVARI